VRSFRASPFRKTHLYHRLLGGGAFSRTENRFYLWVRSKGVLVVAAAGNDSTNTVSYPAAYPSNISVGAVDRNNMHADFSNTGKGLMVSAPGVDVLSSVPRGQGTEASVTAGANTYSAFGMEFAGKTQGITATLVSCGLGNPGDCPSDVAGNIALIQRGTISFSDKVFNAMQEGAVAAIVYNNAPGNFHGTLGTETAPDGSAWIPAISVSDTDGAALLTSVGSTVQFMNVASSWDTFSGTSMATPHVTGVVALIWAVNPALTTNLVQQYLLSTCTDLGTPGYDTTYGFGIVNALAAISQAKK
jgi:serine protease